MKKRLQTFDAIYFRIEKHFEKDDLVFRKII